MNENGKLALLNTICEHPGWQPPHPVSSSTERWLNELQAEELIITRLDGWEATALALEAFPNFALADDSTVKLAFAVAEVGPPRQEDGRPTEIVRTAEELARAKPELVAVITLWETGIEIRQQDGRFHATYVRPGGRRAGFGHTDCLRLMGRMAELLPPDHRP